MLARRTEPRAGSAAAADRAAASSVPGWLPPGSRSRAGNGTAGADADAFLRDAELAGERLSAIVRLVIFLTLLMLMIASGIDHHHEVFVLITVAAYGVIAVIALMLAWRRVFHPALPYAYVTFDVALVFLSVLLISRMIESPPDLTFAGPTSAIIFVVLAHASMRFRPGLVAYAGAVAAMLMAISMAAMPAAGAPVLSSVELQAAHLHAWPLQSRVLPFVITGLATLALWATSRRTSEMLQTSIEYSRRLGNLSRFFSPRLADRLARETNAGLSSGSRQRCAVMFIDIRNFTHLSREMDPEQLSQVLAEFRSVVLDVIFEHDGMVDKFIGDAVLVVFGALQPAPDDARRAIRCGLEVLAAVDTWSQSQTVPRESRLRIGIGAHYGEVFVGAVSSAQMIEFTVLGDVVNLAERLERLTRTIGATFLVSRDMLDAAGLDQQLLRCEPVKATMISERLIGLEVFSLQCPASDNQP